MSSSPTWPESAFDPALAPSPLPVPALAPSARALQTADILVCILLNFNQRCVARAARVNKLWLEASTLARMDTVMPFDGGICGLGLEWLSDRVVEQPNLGARVKRVSIGTGAAIGTSEHGGLYSIVTGFSCFDTGGRIAVGTLLRLCQSVETITIFGQSTRDCGPSANP